MFAHAHIYARMKRDDPRDELFAQYETGIWLFLTAAAILLGLLVYNLL